MMKFFSKVFASTPPVRDNKQTIRELSRKRNVIQSNMNAHTIRVGIQVKSKQLTDPKFAEKKLKESLSKLRVN